MSSPAPQPAWSELSPSPSDEDLVRYINLKLMALGQPVSIPTAEKGYLDVAGPLLRNYYEKDRMLGERLCPADTRVQNFLDAYLGPNAPRLPARSFELDRPGLARLLSLPPDADSFKSPYVDSYRIAQGVLHNPRSDRRTTQGIFHVVEGGLPIAADKLAVPVPVFTRLLTEALQPPDSLRMLPFTANQDTGAHMFLSLLLRPLVCPATGTDVAKSMEIRFLAPASLASNLDFVERIFGNAGDPYIPENDAAADTAHWTGHSGYVILAPHLTKLKKKHLGLPHFDQATERQRRDSMCWRDENELYNGGQAFKLTCRDARGVMVTIIADNYCGYCKKEVKTQISYAANLYGGCEEEHAGGALAFPSYVLGQDFYGDRTFLFSEITFDQAMTLLGERVERKIEGYAIDRRFPTIHYVPSHAQFSVRDGFIRWDGRQLRLRPEYVYVLPSGYRVRLEKQQGGTRWRLVGSRPDGTLCHKPCTVSGGGKSEISKSIANAILKGPVFVSNYHSDMDQVAAILNRDYSGIFKEPRSGYRAGRPILSPDRSLGSVIKLLTPSPIYKDEYNEWLRKLPQILRQLVCTVKRYYRQEWGDNWREHFTVDRVNGQQGNELKFENEVLVGNYLRVGFDPDGSWRIHKLRPDFHPADKVQFEDDITASVVVRRDSLPYLDPEYTNESVKIVANCEQYLFQRPDDAAHRGFDKQSEADLAGPGNFLSNFEPLTLDQARNIVEHIAEFDQYTEPVQHLFSEFVRHPKTDWIVASDQARIVDGARSKNPRYLQHRPDITSPREAHLAEIGARLHRRIPSDAPVFFPVNAVLAGRRGNPADAKAGIPPLAVYNPIHYQELPELFMDFICSLTGKSPSTTGFGSEGALTKRPFNALLPVVDVNNALVAAILTGYAGFTTAAGHIGPQIRVDHDISMLVPEIWCRMDVEERDPQLLVQGGYLEKLEDFEYEGKMILASRLGYRITEAFADRFLGRIFEAPNYVLSEEILRPEKQDLAQFAAGVAAIVEAQARVAQEYFDDGSIQDACPPIRALLNIMLNGSYEGMTADDARFRAMFTRESMLASDWYTERLKAKQSIDSESASLESLRGTLGADPSLHRA